MRVPIGGIIYETSPITLNVAPGVPSAQTPPLPTQPFRSRELIPQTTKPRRSLSPELWQRTELTSSKPRFDNDSPYLGEQIRYASKFYSADSFFIRPIHSSPDFVGFWNPDRNRPARIPRNHRGGRIFGGRIQRDTLSDHRGRHNHRTQYGGRSRRPPCPAHSESTPRPRSKSGLRPLPLNEPASFTGAVGKYEIEASLDADSLTLGESVTMTVTISGQGNFDTLPDPVWRDAPGWRAFENDSFHRSFVQDGAINGSKTFERVLVPDAAGVFDLPPIEYSYFDPELEQYVTVSTDAMPVQVAPDPSAAPIPDPALAATEDGSMSVTDIRHIKPAPSGIGAPSDPVQLSPLIWGLGGLPVAAICGARGLALGGHQKGSRAAGERPGSSASTRAERASPASTQRQPERTRPPPPSTAT